MVNDLVNTWGPRAKFVDDLTILEIVPRNSPSMLGYIVEDVRSFAYRNNMSLNPKKCKTMSIYFLHYNGYMCQPLFVNGHLIESVKSFKFLGVYVSDDLTWSTHCDHVMRKANRRLYALRKLKRSGVPPLEIVKVYCSLVRSTIEYASVVFSNIPDYLQDDIERIQKRALRIIFRQALSEAGISTLASRRHDACVKFIDNVRFNNAVFKLVASRVNNRSNRYPKRHGNPSLSLKPANTERFRNFVTNKFALNLNVNVIS